MQKTGRKSIRILSLALLIALLVQVLSMGTFAKAADMDEIIGTYEGYYYANQGQTGVTLTVYREGSGVKAIFEFYNLPNRSNAAEGSFYMTVTKNSDGSYNFEAGDWIEQPGGYLTVDLEASLSGYTLSGILNNNSGYTFYAEKPNSSYSDVQESIYNGHRYEVVEQGMTWTEAEAYAEEQGGYLAVITSAEEQSYVQSLIAGGSSKQYWLGGHRVSGSFVWVTGESMSYDNFSYGEPNNYRGVETALQIYRVENPNASSNPYEWNDAPDDNVIPGEEEFFSTKYVGMVIEYDAYSNSSDWATPELQKAYDQGLIPDVLIGKDMSETITRGEFAAVACKLYEQLSGNRMIIAMNAPFTDIENSAERLYILKAYNYGIVNGTTTTTYSPEDLITREQMATMLTRVYKKYVWPDYTIATDASYPLDYSGVAKFRDDAQITGYAYQSVYFMAKHKIINGIGNNTFAPNNSTTAEAAAKYANATCEQALLISSRTLDNLGD